MDLTSEVTRLGAWFLTSVVGAGIGSYVGAFTSERGKNLATHADIEKVIAKVEGVTRAQEVIKATISSEQWNKHASLTLKRDAFVAIVSALADYESAAPMGEGLFDYDAPTNMHNAKPGKEAEAMGWKQRMQAAWIALHRSLTVGEFVFDSRTVAALKQNALPEDSISLREIPERFGKLRSALRSEAQRELFGVDE